MLSIIIIIIIVVIIIIIVSSITVFAGVFFVHQPSANHAPEASLKSIIIIIIIIIIGWLGAFRKKFNYEKTQFFKSFGRLFKFFVLFSSIY